MTVLFNDSIINNFSVIWFDDLKETLFHSEDENISFILNLNNNH